MTIPNITHANLVPLSEAVSEVLYRVQAERDITEPGSRDKKVLRKASHHLDAIMNNLNDLAALGDDTAVVRKAMEMPNE